MGFDRSWEDNIYGNRRHINRYPFGQLVSCVMRSYGQRLKNREKRRVLEVGCGTGNNLGFLAEVGFEVYAIEGSETAAKIARQGLTEKGFKAEIIVGDFASIPWPDSFFDLVVDRESIYCNMPADIRRICSEVTRVLKPGGGFLSFKYSTAHGDIKHGEGKLIDDNTYAEMRNGSFVETGIIHFFKKEEVIDCYFKGFDIKYMYHNTNDILMPEKRNEFSEFITYGVKM